MKQLIKRLLLAACISSSCAPLHSGSGKALLTHPQNSFFSSLTTNVLTEICTPFNSFWGITATGPSGLALTGVSIASIAALLRARTYCKNQSYSQDFQKEHPNASYFFDSIAVPLIDASFVIAGTLFASRILKLTGLIKGTMRITDALLVSLMTGLLRLYFDHVSSTESLSCRPENPTAQFADLVGFEKVPRIDPQAPSFKFPKNTKTFSPLERRACLLLEDIFNNTSLFPFYQKILLCGPAGTGKTAFAKALAGSAGIPILTVPINDIKKGEYGRSEENITFAFQRAEELALRHPLGRAILLLDEFEMFGERRDLTANHKADAKLSGQLLALLADEQFLFRHVIVIACTNHLELIDPALISRFTGKIERMELPPKDKRQALISRLFAENHFATHHDSTSSKNPDTSTTAAEFAATTETRDFRFIKKIIEEAAYRAGCQGIPLNEEILYTTYDEQINALQPATSMQGRSESPYSSSSSSATLGKASSVCGLPQD